MLQLTLKRKEIPVEIDGNQYKLIELTGAQRDAYLQSMAGRVRTTPDGKSAGIKTFDGLQTSLVTLTLHDGDGKNVPEATLKGWPASTVEALFKESQKLSGMNLTEEEKEAALKNA